MWLVFLLALILIGIIFSRVEVDLREIYITDKDYNFKIIISLKLFGKIRVLFLKLDRFGIKLFGKKLNINTNKIKKIDKDTFKLLKDLKLDLEKVNFNLKIGLIDLTLTNLAIVLFSSLFPNLVRNRLKSENLRYEVLPEYNKFYISFKGNFSVTVKLLRLLKINFRI